MADPGAASGPAGGQGSNRFAPSPQIPVSFHAMKFPLSRFLTVGWAVVALSVARAQAPTTASTNPPAAHVAKPADKPAETKPAKPAHARYPFHGTVKSVDTKAMTVTLEGKEKDRLLRLNGESRLARDGKDITLSGISAGDYLHGTAVKNDRAEEVIVSAQSGPKPQPKTKAAAAAKPDAKADSQGKPKL